MRDPRWLLSRLRAMSPAEVAHRGWRLARHPIDRARMKVGLYARVPRGLADWTGPEKFYATKAPCSAAWLARADRICAGERCVLGLGWLALGDEPWHREPLAGGEWPKLDGARMLGAAPAGFDARLTWELNRGHEWVVLARAVAATGTAKYGERLAAELASWRKANPIGIGINWASAMEAAIRLHSLAWVAGLAGGDGALAAMIHEHATFVADHLSAHSSANNHLLVELSGLVVASRAIGGPWREDALEELEAEVARQVFDDGANVEMATHYHAFVLEALLLVADLERLHGAARPELEHAIAKMADFLATLCCGGALLGQGDSDEGRILPCYGDHYERALVAAARALDKRGSVPWLELEELRPDATAVPTRSRRFEASGQIILRGPKLVATFDAGPFGFGSLAAHAHCDALALNAAIGGRRVLVDRGTYRYNGDAAARDAYRRTAAHNTLQLADEEQAASAGPFLWSRQPSVKVERCELTDVGDFVQASHDGFSARHRRTLVHRAGLLLICDELDGRGAATIRFHLAPELLLAPTAAGCFRVTDRTTGDPVAWLFASTPRSRVVPFPHSDRYLATTTADTLECSADLDPDSAFFAILGPIAPARCLDGLRELVRLASTRLPAPVARRLRSLPDDLAAASGC